LAWQSGDENKDVEPRPQVFIAAEIEWPPRRRSPYQAKPREILADGLLATVLLDRVIKKFQKDAKRRRRSAHAVRSASSNRLG
jgi:hypothetical protein